MIFDIKNNSVFVYFGENKQIRIPFYVDGHNDVHIQMTTESFYDVIDIFNSHAILESNNNE